MNIYNTLYFIEYSKDPISIDEGNFWFYNSSKSYFYMVHRDFDLYSVVYDKYRYSDITHSMKNTNVFYYYRFGKIHRLIGPAITDVNENDIFLKNYYINGIYKS